METLILKQISSDIITEFEPSLDRKIYKKEETSKEDNILLTLKEILEALARIQHEQYILTATKREQNNIERKTDIKKNKDITLFVDDDDSREKLKNSFIEGLLSITIDMDGFERFHLQQYQQQLVNYARFLAEYLEGKNNALMKTKDTYTYNDEKKQDEIPKTEVQMITYAETQEYARAAAINAMLGKVAANHVDPQMKEMWDLWRVFQHNQHMSFYYVSQWRGYGV